MFRKCGATLKFKVTLQPSGHRFEVGDDTAVLTAGLEAGLNMPYSCRAGNCRTCRGRILSGRVDYNVVHGVYLTDAQKASGYALLCKAKPLSDLVINIEELALDRIAPKIVPCRIKRITKPVPDVAIINLRLPMNENLMFAPGQFVDFILAEGKTRSYSIATAPMPEGVIDLELHVRHAPGGLFTDRVFGAPQGGMLQEGELLRFRGPLGSFFLREDSDKPIIFLASGTGFAPIKSMIDYADRRGIKRPMRLYWGGRTQRDLYMDPPLIAYTPVLSEQPWAGRRGYVHRAVMEDFPDLSGHQVYACGAPPMVDAARADFTQKCGLPEHEFFADSFLTEADLN